MIITKWCIRRTPATASEINTWFSKVTGKIYTSVDDWHPNWGRQEPHWTYLHYPSIKTNIPLKGRSVFRSPRKEYVEITFQEFRRCILRKGFIKSKWKKELKFSVERDIINQKLKIYDDSIIYRH